MLNKVLTVFFFAILNVTLLVKSAALVDIGHLDAKVEESEKSAYLEGIEPKVNGLGYERVKRNVGDGDADDAAMLELEKKSQLGRGFNKFRTPPKGGNSNANERGGMSKMTGGSHGFGSSLRGLKPKH